MNRPDRWTYCALELYMPVECDPSDRDSVRYEISNYVDDFNMLDMPPSVTAEVLSIPGDDDYPVRADQDVRLPLVRFVGPIDVMETVIDYVEHARRPWVYRQNRHNHG